MTLSANFNRIKRIPYNTCSIQDKLVLVYAQLNHHKQETGQYCIEDALKFFINTPLNHELSLKYFNNVLWKYSIMDQVPESDVIDTILSLADTYGRINNPMEVAKTIFGTDYSKIEQLIINAVTHLIQNSHSDVERKSIIKRYKFLGIDNKNSFNSIPA